MTFLACTDGQHIEAHKVILAASSPFLAGVLKTNKHPHPIIYMRGIKFQDLTAMIDFLYHGEANVYQDDLDSFLAIAEEFQLKGLMGGTDDAKAKEETKQSYAITDNGNNEDSEGSSITKRYMSMHLMLLQRNQEILLQFKTTCLKIFKIWTKR